MSSQPDRSANPSRTPPDEAAHELSLRAETPDSPRGAEPDQPDRAEADQPAPHQRSAEPDDRPPVPDEGGQEPVAPAEESYRSEPSESSSTGSADAGDQLGQADDESPEPEVPDASDEDPREDVAPAWQAPAVDADEELQHQWYILKVQVNREESIRDALLRRIKIENLDRFFDDIIVPTEDVAEFNKSGKRRIVKRKLYPGYIMVHMTLNDDTWFLVRETPGIGDFTGSAGKPTPMDPNEVKRIIDTGRDVEGGEGQVKTAIPFRTGDRVRVKEGYFQNFEGDVESIDEANGRVTVMINIFGRSTPVELEHWQIEAV